MSHCVVRTWSRALAFCFSLAPSPWLSDVSSPSYTNTIPLLGLNIFLVFACPQCLFIGKKIFELKLNDLDIQKVFRPGPLHPQPRILCLHGSPDGPGQYVAVMNSIFSAQRSMVPIDSCVIGAQHSAFLQQASYITGGVYLKPQHLDGLLQCLLTVFATDLHSRSFLLLPKPAGVDFRASCFCHKRTIDMGYICSVCLSIFCEHQKKCSTCGSIFGQAQTQDTSMPDRKGKAPMV